MNWAGRISLSLYRYAGYAFSPFTPLFLAVRKSKGKEIAPRKNERYGKASKDRPAGPLVWVHAASVGETNAVLPLVNQIVESGSNVLLTTITVTSSQIAEKRLPRGAVHQFIPLDIAPYVRRFLDHWRPDMALFVESEMWPIIMSELNRHDIPLIIVNGRMSDRSFTRWSKVPFVTQKMFGSVPLCLTQSEEDKQRYSALGVRNVEVTGNLKFDVPPPQADEDELAAMQTMLANRKVWIAASTHPGEERLFAKAHRRMMVQIPDLLTIIVPRHPERGPEIERELNAVVGGVQRRTQNTAITDKTQIYLCDTMGELGLFYRLSRIAFVGGSLVNHGGQNPIEPARLGCAILHGPNVGNFKDIYKVLDQSAGGECIASERELIRSLSRLLDSPGEVHRRSELARHSLRPYAGALEMTLMALTPFLNPLKINAELNRFNLR